MQSNDFREAVFKVVNQLVNPVNLREADKVSEATTSILALCKEMLVPEEEKGCGMTRSKKPEYGCCGECFGAIAYNEARQHLLKQLGEKI